MSLDERIKSLARQVVAETSTVPAAAVDSGELAVVLSRLDALHEELHAVATRVAALEKQTDGPSAEGALDPVPRARRTRKATDE
jgi:hypothetical protein